MSFRSFLIAAAACALATPAVAQTEATSPAPEAPKPKKPKMICRQEGDTGSHFSRRVCHTPAQWAALDGAAGNGIRRATGIDDQRN